MILLFTTFFCSLALGNGDTSYTHHMVLHDPEYLMSWKFDETDITIKLKVKTKGWIEWGLSPTGGMKGADLIIAWLDSKGKHFDDYFSDGNGPPKKDNSQDYQLIDMYETDGWLTTIFKRKIKLADAEDITITESTMRIIYSWGESDPLSEDNLTYDQIRRGTRSAYLLDHRDQAKEELPDQYKTFDMVMTDFQVPAEDTSYWCKIIKMPDMGSKKQHLFRIDPIITKGNEGVVHHIVLYTCTKWAEEDVNVQHNCYRTRNMPSRHCKTIMTHAWAIGGSNFYYPSKAGLPLNTEDDPKYYLIEIHYDNPGKVNNIVDNSGLRVYYTEQLRQYDSTILTLGIKPGLDMSQIIPQQQESFTSYGFCPSLCLPATKKFYIYAYALHTHLGGRKIVVRLIDSKTGKQNKVIAQDLTYDFNYQTTHFMKDPIEITPGHQIDVDCTYSTMNRDEPLLGGLGTNEEMCLAFLFVYPRLDISQCDSMSGSVHSWGANTYGWDVNRLTYKFNKPTKVAGKNYDGYAYEPLREKEFWSDKIGNKSLIKSYEKSMLSELYQYDCKYRRGVDRKRGLASNKQRLIPSEDEGKEESSHCNLLRPFFVFLFLPAFVLYFNLQ